MERRLNLPFKVHGKNTRRTISSLRLTHKKTHHSFGSTLPGLIALTRRPDYLMNAREEAIMKQFRSIEKIDTAILYTLELTSSISVLLLAFGLIASMANVLTQGSVLTDNLVMQRVWAWTRSE